MKNLGTAASMMLICICSDISLSVPPALLTVGNAVAQTDYPTRAVQLLHGFGPGTSPDIAARALGDKLSLASGKPVIIENTIGASGNIAGGRVARAEPDGHTLLLAASSEIVMNPSLYGKMPYDPIKDLAPISIV
jgi:tripartite-type tricarboxylate transporter receptor subunit TctC